MKNVILYLLTPFLTFTLGVGVQRLIFQRAVATAPPVAVEQPREVITQFVPVETPAKPVIILDAPDDIYGIHGGFFIMGKKPKAFADFDNLEVTLSNHGASNYIAIFENGKDVYDTFEASFALVTPRTLFLVTRKGNKSDFEYRFDGEFVRTDFDKIAGKQKVALRGTLTRTKDGRKVAEQVFNFRMDYLGC